MDLFLLLASVLVQVSIVYMSDSVLDFKVDISGKVRGVFEFPPMEYINSLDFDSKFWNSSLEPDFAPGFATFDEATAVCAKWGGHIAYPRYPNEMFDIAQFAGQINYFLGVIPSLNDQSQVIYTSVTGEDITAVMRPFWYGDQENYRSDPEFNTTLCYSLGFMVPKYLDLCYTMIRNISMSRFVCARPKASPQENTTNIERPNGTDPDREPIYTSSENPREFYLGFETVMNEIVGVTAFPRMEYIDSGDLVPENPSVIVDETIRACDSWGGYVAYPRYPNEMLQISEVSKPGHIYWIGVDITPPSYNSLDQRMSYRSYTVGKEVTAMINPFFEPGKPDVYVVNKYANHNLACKNFDQMEIGNLHLCRENPREKSHAYVCARPIE